jgi:membrane protease YdiL (CAAX protease family)
MAGRVRASAAIMTAHDSQPAPPGPDAPQSPPFIPMARPLVPIVARPARSENPMRLDQVSAGAAALHLLAAAGLLGIVVLGAGVGMALYFGVDRLEDPEGLGVGVLMGVTLATGLVMSVGVLLINRIGGLSRRALGLTNRDTWVNVLLGFAVVPASFAAALATVAVMALVWPEGIDQLTENPDRIEAMLPDVGLGGLAAMMVVIAFYEELVFRGFLLPRLRRITRSWTVAVLITSALFAAIHLGEDVGAQTFATLFPLFAVAVLWSVVTIWRKSLLPAIIGHALFNFLQLAALQISSEWAGTP